MIIGRTIRAALALALAAGAALALPRAARAQDGEGWDGPRALELVQRAQARRQQTQADTGLADYQADARGYIYFYLDRRDTGERSLVKTDQVALDVYWKAPAFSKQRIIGLRDRRDLPTNIHYHQDHLTVVQDNFGDLIRLGDGDEVADVLHPAAAQGPAQYQYRLVDSTSIRLPGAGEPVRVYRLDVRPRDASRPALVGAIYVDRRAGDIVRLDFTFTPSSYVDRNLDYINIRLENGLYKGRFWLPNRQQVELRRQLPELGLPAGGVIRGTMRVTNYRFNQNLPDALFRGRRVVSVSQEQRESFAFEDSIDAELRETGIGPSTELGEVRRQAAELLRGQLLSGLPATRLDVATGSATVRYNRAEGLAVTPGLRLTPAEGVSLALRGGYAFGAEHALAGAELSTTTSAGRASLRGYLNEPRDVGYGPVISGAMNSLTALLAGYDFLDPFYASGAELRLQPHPISGWNLDVRLRAEEHDQAAATTDFSVFGGSSHFRSVSAALEGTLYGATLGLRREAPAEVARAWSGGLSAEIARFVPADLERDLGEPVRTYARPRADAGLLFRLGGGRELELQGSAGTTFGETPPQAVWRIGGRGTVPGQPFRAYGGDSYAFARATWSQELLRPFLRGRLFAAAGWAGDRVSEDPVVIIDDVQVMDVVYPFIGPPREGRIVSVGAGVGILYDILRIDVARGLGAEGRWEVVVEANPGFWDFL